MRRKSTRSSAKASPEKAKEEKPVKKARRHSKRAKVTSSESEHASDDEVSLSSTDNGNNPTEKELWTVTQSNDQSNNDIGKIKICLARPSPATPERSSKRLRNRSTAPEDTPSDDVKQPPSSSTRRSRRRGGSSPQKKDEPSPTIEQQQHVELVDEKKGKGKSKGKHKSKIVEQTGDDVVEHTEMQSELSENVQVTPQSPQNVDNSAADSVDCALNQIEATRAEESVHSVDADRHDTLETRTDHDLSNNNVTNVERLSPAHAKPEDAGDDAADGPQAAIIQDSESKDDDIESAEKPESERNEKTEQDIQQPSFATDQEQSKIETVQQDETNDESDTEAAQEQPPEQKEEEVDVQPESKSTEVETISSEIAEDEEKPKGESEQEEKSIEPEIEVTTTTTALKTNEEVSEVTETSREHSPSPKPDSVKSSKEEDIETKKIASEQVLSITFKLAIDQEDNNDEEEEEEMSDSKQEESQDVKTSAESCESKEENQESSSESTPEQGHQPRILRKRSWGEGTTTLEYLIITSKKLAEMYPNLAMQDESSVKLQSKRETRREYIVERPPVKIANERTLVVEEEETTKKQTHVGELDNGHEDSPEQTLEHENGTCGNLNVHRKISIVEDEASMLKPPPSPAEHDKSDVLFITNLVRPFTVKQLRGLLERTGKITEDGFWTDKIKSKCYVQYETEEEAEATRNALHGVLWPVGNGKKLMIDFAMQEDLENARNPPVIPPVAVEEAANENKQISKEVDIADVPINKESQETSTLWNEEYKETKTLQRAISPEPHKRQHRMRSRSFSEEPKKKIRREEPAPQRAMDDLFKKTTATPSIYWQSLTAEEIELKQQQRQERMEAHKRKMESEMRTRRNSDRQQAGPYRRRY